MRIDLSAVISLGAFVLSIIALYFQWFKVRGAIIDLLNSNEHQRAIVRTFEQLPDTVRQNFSKYNSDHPGYAILRLVFSNSGDRPGLTKISRIYIDDSSKNRDNYNLSFSYYTHSIISSLGITQQDIILRNIPLRDEYKDIHIIIELEWGTPNLRKGKYIKKGFIKQNLTIVLEH